MVLHFIPERVQGAGHTQHTAAGGAFRAEGRRASAGTESEPCGRNAGRSEARSGRGAGFYFHDSGNPRQGSRQGVMYASLNLRNHTPMATGDVSHGR